MDRQRRRGENVRLLQSLEEDVTTVVSLANKNALESSSPVMTMRLLQTVLPLVAEVEDAA